MAAVLPRGRVWPATSVTLPSGDVLRGFVERIPVKMPNAAYDTSERARAYIRRNAGRAHDCHTFLGIPYATQPVGANRWAAPTMTPGTPSTPWDCTTPRNIPMQTTGPSRERNLGTRPPDQAEGGVFEWNKLDVRENEACAYLDVRTPNPRPGAKLPVRVHFHDGGNTENPRILHRFQGDRLTRLGIVSVEVDYPLSTWGFFTHPAFGDAHNPNVSYLFGLKALEWVQENIAAFGGDPDCVEVEGASAGGAMSSLLIPSSAGLFHRVIAHSGNGIGRRLSRARAEARGVNFWDRLIKDVPAYHDPTRTIAEIAADDGIAVALRLGPSPEQIQAFGNARDVWTGWDGSPDRSTAGPTNIWPVQDGDTIRNVTSAAEITAGRWPAGIDYMATWAFNEATVINNAVDVIDGDQYLAQLNLSSPPERRAAAIAALAAGPNDRWQRLAYGHVVYGFGCYLNAKRHAAQGGRAYYAFFDYDSLGTGRQKSGHAHLHQYFLDKPEWQLQQALGETTLQGWWADMALAEWCAQSAVNFMASGDPNATYDNSSLPPLFEPGELDGLFDAWEPFGTGPSYRANIIRNDFANGDLPAMRVVDDHERTFFALAEEHCGY